MSDKHISLQTLWRCQPEIREVFHVNNTLGGRVNIVHSTKSYPVKKRTARREINTNKCKTTINQPEARTRSRLSVMRYISWNFTVQHNQSKTVCFRHLYSFLLNSHVFSCVMRIFVHLSYWQGHPTVLPETSFINFANFCVENIIWSLNSIFSYGDKKFLGLSSCKHLVFCLFVCCLICVCLACLF